MFWQFANDVGLIANQDTPLTAFANGKVAQSEALAPAMHLLRLLLTGTAMSRADRVPVRVEAHREHLLEVNRDDLPWAEADAWRKELHRDFARALIRTKLPDPPTTKRRIASSSDSSGNGKPRMNPDDSE
ncbi:MAG: nucleotidyltransferase domain-containing protein [Verrucomicrobia bacterium]|nr:nucleotidyltransferase domain-containing protein [Verrucomicrobiota bacterium]